MTKIIDIRALQGGGRSGVEVYIEGFLYNFFIEKKSHENEDVILWINAAGDVILPDFLNDYINLQNVHLAHTKIPNKIFNFFCSVLRRPKIDKLPAIREILKGGEVELFVPDPRPAPVSKYVKKNIVVHDLSPIKFPHFFSLKSKLWFLLLRLRKELKEASMVYAVSKFTESELIAFEPSLQNKIVVQYPVLSSNRCRPIFSDDYFQKVRAKYKLPSKPFLFTISTLEPRKNVEVLIENFLNGDFEYEFLVIAGKGNDKIFKKTAYKQSPSIIFTKNLSEDEKWAFYHMASGFACLSHYEGYGIPVKDAMNFKLPLILSDIPVFHEITAGYKDIVWVKI